MKQRLIWNFELSGQKNSLSKPDLLDNEVEKLKWEIRFFWPANTIILLNNIDEQLINLSHYQCKFREDTYYLLPTENYNIKRRRNELFYKPLVQQAKYALGFGGKINLDALTNDPANSYLQELAHLTLEKGIAISVKKEAFIYKFPTTPTTKLELARLQVLNNIYFSACIEGKSKHLVETIVLPQKSHLLLKKCDVKVHLS